MLVNEYVAEVYECIKCSSGSVIKVHHLRSQISFWNDFVYSFIQSGQKTSASCEGVVSWCFGLILSSSNSICVYSAGENWAILNPKIHFARPALWMVEFIFAMNRWSIRRRFNRSALYRKVGATNLPWRRILAIAKRHSPLASALCLSWLVKP